MTRAPLLAALCLALLGGASQAQTPQAPPTETIRIPTPSGEVLLTGAQEKLSYERFGFAAVRRAGDTVYISGVIVSRRPEEGTDVAAFKGEVRRVFERIGGYLKAAGLTFDDVTMMNTFHIWQGPNFTGTKTEQFQAFEQVEAEFMKGPKPAWTAVGVTGLLADSGIVEVQMIAQAPTRRR